MVDYRKPTKIPVKCDTCKHNESHGMVVKCSKGINQIMDMYDRVVPVLVFCEEKRVEVNKNE